jgi:hypothetical protein
MKIFMKIFMKTIRMKSLCTLLALFFVQTSYAQALNLQCRIYENRKLTVDKTIAIESTETTIADLGEYLVQIKTPDKEFFSLTALDRYEEIRTYAEARLMNPEDRVVLALWKRSGLLEVECRRLSLRARH